MRLGTRLLTNKTVQRTIGRLSAQYLRLVWNTTRFTSEPVDAYERGMQFAPAIIAMWHGQHFLSPLLRREQDAVKALISHHRDGEINALVAKHFGIDVIRGSGDHAGGFLSKGGVGAFVTMMRALEDGYSVAVTADVPKISRVAGFGIVKLAKMSGRPICPIAIATHWHFSVNNWDRTTVNLPFGRGSCVLGQPITVPPDADDQQLESARAALQKELDTVTARAYAIAGRKAGSR